jgi:hypothetical protein
MNDVVTEQKREQGLIVVKRWQDVRPYLDANKTRANNFTRSRKANMRLVAEIPNIVVEQWLKLGVNVYDRNDAKKVQQLLNSNEYKWLRTSPGKCKVS